MIKYARFFQFAKILSKFFIYSSFLEKIRKKKKEMETTDYDNRYSKQKYILCKYSILNRICHYYNQTLI